MKIRLLFVLFILPLIAACSGPADPDKQVSTFWHTLPPEEFEAGQVTLQEDDVLIRQEVRPKSVAILEEDVLNSRGSVIAAAGTRLHASQVGTGRTVYCKPRSSLDSNILTTILTNNDRNALCLSDRDEDGQFEERQKVPHKMSILPIVTGVMRNIKPIDPVRYTLEEGGKLDKAYYVELRYFGPPDIFFENNRNFSLYGGTEEEMDNLPQSHSVNIKELPKDFSMLGAKITVIEEGVDGLVVNFKTPMSSEGFTLFWTTRTYVY